MAILHYGELCFGVLFDKTGEIFHSKNVYDMTITEEDHSCDHIIKRIFKLNKSQRIIQDLDPYQILQLEKVPKTKSLLLNSVQKKKGQRRQCISFKIIDSLCAFDIKSIEEIYEIDHIEESSLSGGITLGVVYIRNNPIPVISFKKILKRGLYC